MNDKKTDLVLKDGYNYIFLGGQLENNKIAIFVDSDNGGGGSDISKKDAIKLINHLKDVFFNK